MRRRERYTWAYYSSALREEGRLAAIVGDTAGALKAYQHYLALRTNAEPALKPDIDRIKQEITKLGGDAPR